MKFTAAQIAYIATLGGTWRHLVSVTGIDGPAPLFWDVDVSLGYAGAPVWVFDVNGYPYNSPPYVIVDIGPLVADTEYSVLVHVKLDAAGTSATVTPTVNGVGGLSFTPDPNASVVINWPWPNLRAGVGLMQLAARERAGDSGLLDYSFDSVTIGTSGPGSSEIFGADFNTGGVSPPFDSAVPGFAVSGGRLQVSNPGPSSVERLTVTL